MEKEALWRKVICNKYKLDNLLWLPSLEPNRLFSTVWKDIALVGQRDVNLFRLFMSNVKIQVGDGCKVRFWLDVWVGDAPLSTLFPRIFNVCSQKLVVVADACHSNGPNLDLHLDLRRNILPWELEDWNNLLNMVNSVALQPHKSDCLCWKADSSGVFLVSSLYKCREAELGHPRRELQLLWKNHAPPKAQFLGWLAVLERVKTSELLLSLGVLTNLNDCLCKFCGDALETANHLFLHCKFVWSVWCMVVKWWGIIWVVPSSIKSLFIWWQSWRFKKAKKVLWELVSFAIIWSIWKLRNDLIFQGVVPRWVDMGDIIKFKVANWFKAYQGSRVFSTNDILLRFPALIQSLR